MDFSLAEEQQQLRESAGGYLAARYPLSRLAAIADGTHGSVASSWPELVALGWLDSGVGGVERAILAEQAGYHLLPTPWWTTVALAAPFLHQQKLSWDQPATYADGVGRAATDEPVRATDGPAGWRLSGTAPLVAEAGPACLLVVRAATGTGTAVFTVATDASGVQVTELSTHDSLRPMARVDFADAPAELLADGAQAAALTPTADAWAGAMLAAEAVGVAARALDLAVDHARSREQFGRPIGSFQAVAHQLADGYVRVETARSLAYRAGHLLDTDDDQAELHCAVAAAVVAGREAAVGCCETALQVTGGMGMTWEYPLHRWLRRALWLSAYPVGTRPHETIAAHLLDDPAPV